MVQSSAEPEFTSDARQAVARAVAEFNRGRYFECHETLEKVWSGLRGPSRDFFQALIQVSVGFHHLGRGNRAGALKTFAKALRRLNAYPARYLGFDVGAERARLLETPTGPPPVWRFDDFRADEDAPNP